VGEETVNLAALPMPLTWLRRPAAWSLEGEELTIAAGAQTDWFADPGGRDPVLNAPVLVGTPTDRDFTLAARVSLDGAATFDAGVLFIHADDQTWAKLCLERSPQGRPTIVSVVTRDESDDCNSEATEIAEAWLRIARSGEAIAFHASTDGVRWELIRHFRLRAPDFAVGFAAQSPTGPGCSVTFAEIVYANRQLADLRDGS
jgi:regulation of enolase protein 1 (concanavalin A-like superfamily)